MTTKTLKKMDVESLEIRCYRCEKLLGYAIELEQIWYCDVRCRKEECMKKLNLYD